MLTLKQLLRKTDVGRKANAKYVKVVQVKYKYNKANSKGVSTAYVAAITYSTAKLGPDGKLVKNFNPTRYVTQILFLNEKLQCKVSCSCDDALFRWEWANNRRKAADIEYSNGEPPDILNPQYKPGLCKHLVRLYQTIQSKLPPGF